MGKTIKPQFLAEALREELEAYSVELTERVNAAGAAAAKDLKKRTKATAPVASGSFKRHITVTEKVNELGVKTFVWHVKAPDHRLTHLLVHGHATRNGGRTKSNPFLQNALDAVLPEYEKAVKEAVQSD